MVKTIKNHIKADKLLFSCLILLDFSNFQIFCSKYFVWDCSWVSFIHAQISFYLFSVNYWIQHYKHASFKKGTISGNLLSGHRNAMTIRKVWWPEAEISNNHESWTKTLHLVAWKKYIYADLQWMFLSREFLNYC